MVLTAFCCRVPNVTLLLYWLYARKRLLCSSCRKGEQSTNVMNPLSAFGRHFKLYQPFNIK